MVLGQFWQRPAAAAGQAGPDPSHRDSDYEGRPDASLREVVGRLEEGRLKYQKDMVRGLESSRRTSLGPLTSQKFGRLLAQANPDPTRGARAGGRAHGFRFAAATTSSR